MYFQDKIELFRSYYPPRSDLLDSSKNRHSRLIFSSCVTDTGYAPGKMILRRLEAQERSYRLFGRCYRPRLDLFSVKGGFMG